MVVKNLDKLLRRFHALPVSIQTAAQLAQDEMATKMVAEMKVLVPVDQGKLSASIRKERRGPISMAVLAGDETTEVRVGGISLQNAALQEYGTKKMPANPFFGPVVRVNRQLAQRRIRAAAIKAAKAEWGV